MELTQQARDVRALADAEIDAEFVMACHAWIDGGSSELPQPREYGMTEEEGCKLAAEVIAVSLSEIYEAADHGAWFERAAQIVEERRAG